MIKLCNQRHLYCGQHFSLLSEERGFYMRHRRPLHLLANHLRNILTESAQSLAVLVPASSSMAAVSKAFTPLPRKSDRSDAEVSERCESHLLRFVAWKSLSSHDFALKSSAQMVRPEFTRTHLYKQLLSLECPQELANFVYR